MQKLIKTRKKSFTAKLLSHALIGLFLTSTISPNIYAQSVALPTALPAPGKMLELSKPFDPVSVKGVILDPEHPFKFDFVMDSGDTGLQGEALRPESMKIIKYFLAALTVPDDEMWVNLSPYEKERIIPKSFGETAMGRDVLAQDYILKQLTASLTYPEQKMGKEFWDMVYAKAWAEYHTTNIPVNTFNKVWILPSKAKVYEYGNGAFVVQSSLKVMLEEDYLSLQKHSAVLPLALRNDTHSIGANIVREIIIPALEKEVNEGANFANLRQIYQAMILATWYKIRLKDSILGQLYVNQDKIKGVALNDKQATEKIYHQYLQAFKKGVYNYVKEDYDPQTQQMVPRKYISGGFAYKVARALIILPVTLSLLLASYATPNARPFTHVTWQATNGTARVYTVSSPTQSSASNVPQQENLHNAQLMHFPIQWDENSQLVISSTVGETPITADVDIYVQGKSKPFTVHNVEFPRGNDRFVPVPGVYPIVNEGPTTITNIVVRSNNRQSSFIFYKFQLNFNAPPQNLQAQPPSVLNLPPQGLDTDNPGYKKVYFNFNSLYPLLKLRKGDKVVFYYNFVDAPRHVVRTQVQFKPQGEPENSKVGILPGFEWFITNGGENFHHTLEMPFDVDTGQIGIFYAFPIMSPDMGAKLHINSIEVTKSDGVKETLLPTVTGEKNIAGTNNAMTAVRQIPQTLKSRVFAPLGIENGARKLNPGGIDLNAVNLDLEIKRDDKGMPLPFKFQNLSKIRIEMLYPTNLHIGPPMSVPVLLGSLDSRSLPGIQMASPQFSKLEGAYFRRENI